MMKMLLRSGTILWALAALAVPLEAQTSDGGFVSEEAVNVGDYLYEQATDRFGSGSLWLAVTMSGPEDPNNGEGGFGVMCFESGKQAVVLQTEFLGVAIGDDETQTVKWYIDDGGVQTTTAKVATSGVDGTVMAAVDGDLIAQAKTGRRLHVLVHDYNEVRETYAFSLIGLTAALERMPCTF